MSDTYNVNNGTMSVPGQDERIELVSGPGAVGAVYRPAGGADGEYLFLGLEQGAQPRIGYHDGAAPVPLVSLAITAPGGLGVTVQIVIPGPGPDADRSRYLPLELLRQIVGRWEADQARSPERKP